MVVVLGGAVGLNSVAYLHARAMSHFVPEGSRTPKPEQLGVFGKLRVLLTGVQLPRPINHGSPADMGLAFETVRIPSMRGIELEAWRLPASAGTDGPLVLLFGGYGGSKDGLLNVAGEFLRLEAEVWMVDFRGCGGSTGNITSIGFHEAEDVSAAVRRAQQGSAGRKLVLFGTSMGAAAVLHAVHRGDVSPDGLVLECPFDRLLSTAANRFRLMKLPAFPFAQLLVFWGGFQQGFDGFAHNPADYAGSVRCPTLLLQGERDERVTLEQANRIAGNLGSHGRLVVLPGLGHQSYVAAQPEQWRNAVSTFLESMSSATSR
jgi:alpha-beta hydrolase superfamily lysophospholipase